jgi:hypothetical protein
MTPIPRAGGPRIVIYHQTTHDPSDNPISVIPLLKQTGSFVTHIIVAAIHINEDPLDITLNNHHPNDARHATLWAELRIAQASGVRVLGMLGGAAKGSYMRLDKDEQTFEAYYLPVRDLIRERALDGLDLDIEEYMSLGGVVRLIDRLRADFGKDFIITLAPVATALLNARRNLSGFNYEALEVMRGDDIAWYNAQFYNRWGDASTPLLYEMIIAKGYRPEKVVLGLLTSSENGRGWVPWEVLKPNLMLLKSQFAAFGGVMGWEYFNSSPGGRDRPWEWARQMTELLRMDNTLKSVAPAMTVDAPGEAISVPPTSSTREVDPDVASLDDAPLPASFEYYSDGFGSDA